MRVTDRILTGLYSAQGFKESKATGNTGYYPDRAVVTLYGHEIIGLSPGGYYPVQWIDLCGMPTSLTIRRINLVMGIALVYRKSGKTFLRIRHNHVLEREHIFDVPDSGRVPLWGLIRTISNTR